MKRYACEEINLSNVASAINTFVAARQHLNKYKAFIASVQSGLISSALELNTCHRILSFKLQQDCADLPQTKFANSTI